jgi:mono/diheme cytochrome c family protein
MTFRAFSIGFSAAVLALACGSDSGGDGGGSDDPEEVIVDPGAGDDPVVQRPVETCDDNPLLAGCPPVDNGGDNGGPGPVEEPAGETPADLARAAAANILESNCGGCHGPALTPEQAFAGMNYIDDFDQLVENNKVQPLNSAGSRIIQRMRSGEMPPPNANQDRVSDQEIDVVASFIDEPTFWPDYAGAGGSCADQLISFDDVYSEIARDLSSLDEDDALTARYIVVTNRATAGVCVDTTLDRDRQAIFKLVNMLSTETTVEEPVAVDPDQTIYRIDLEDYGWEEPVTVVNADGSTTDFTDKWEAIIGNNAYAVPFVGDDADDAVQDSGTLVPVMLADSLLDAASIGNLYYALVGINVQDTLDNFILNDLDIDVAQNLLDEEQVRAGTTRSRISRQDRVVQRDEIGVRQGVLWQSFDFLADDANQSIFEDPFGFAEGGTEAIFTLPNGLFGFIIADENSAIVEDSDILLDTNQNNFRAVTSISCSNCHAQGLIPVVDEVRDIALSNAITSGLNNDEVEQLEAVYPDSQEFARIVESDSTGFFQRALADANVPIQGGDVVSQVFFRFDQDIRLNDAAGDLGVSPEFLDDNLNILEPEIQVLDGGTIDRDDFTQFYVVSLCVLSVVNENQPDQAFCDAAAADLGIVLQ